MKTNILTTVLFALCMALILNTVDAQEKTVKVITNSNSAHEVKVFTDKDEIDEETLNLLKEKGIDINNLREETTEHYKIKIVDDNGEVQEMEWDGNGEMPEEMKKHIDEIDIEEDGDIRMVKVSARGAQNNDDSNFSEKKVKIKIIDGSGNMEESEWNGEGEMPEQIRIFMNEVGDEGEAKCKTFKLSVDEEKFMRGEDMKVIFIDDEDLKDKAQLGVFIEDNDQGVMVNGTIEGSGAEKAGVLEEDIIQYLNGAPINDIDDLVEAIEDLEIGDVARLKVLRDGKTKEIDVTLGQKQVRSYITEVECDWTSKECKKICDIEKCMKEKNMTSEECKKLCDLSKCKKECSEMECCKKDKDSAFTAPRNTLKVKEFNAFPNPSDGLINIEFEAQNKPLIVQVLDINGQSLYKDVLNNFEGTYSKQIDLRNKGISSQVFVSIIQNEKMYTESLIIN